MFVRCHECGWESEEAESVDALADMVAEAGGHLCNLGETGNDDECPACHLFETLTVD